MSKKNSEGHPRSRAEKKANKYEGITENRQETLNDVQFKKIGIGVAVTAGIAAIALLVIFVLVPLVKNGKSKINYNKLASEASKNSKYTYTNYNNSGVLPEELAKVLNEFNSENAAASETYGSAFKTGDRSFSFPYVCMIYVDVYTKHLTKASSDLNTYGESTENFPTEKFAEYEQYSDDETWGEYLLKEVGDDIADKWYLFDKALEEGFVPTDEQIDDIIYNYSFYTAYSSSYSSIDAMVESYYVEGVTYNMYAASMIVTGYADAYREHVKDEYKKDITIEEAEEKMNGSELDYQVFKGRIYVIQGEGADYSGVTTEDEFLQYAATDSGVTLDAADEGTDVNYITYATLEDGFGEELADFVFSPDRKAGEVCSFSNGKYDFLIYVEKPAYYECSVNCTICYEFFTSSDDSENESNREDLHTQYKVWVRNGAHQDALEQLCETVDNSMYSLPYGTIDLSVNTFDSSIDEWLRDPARKEGDYKIFDLDSSSVIVRFNSINSDDLDGINEAEDDIAEEMLESSGKYVADADHEPQFNSSLMFDICSSTHDAITNVSSGLIDSTATDITDEYADTEESTSAES